MSVVARRWQALPLAWRRAVLGTVALWAIVLLGTVLAAGTIPFLPFTPDPPAPGFDGWPTPDQGASGSALLRSALVRFDAQYYLGIAADGYPVGAVATPSAVPNAFAFFPAYPAAVAVVAFVTGGRVLVAATLVSSAATIASLAGVHRLAELVLRDDDPLATTAGRAVVVTVLFPTSFFLLAPYAESLHLAAVVWALLAAARQRPWAAAALGALAAAARPVGVILAASLLVVLSDDGTWRSRVRRVAAASGPALGVLVVLFVGWLHTGLWFAPTAAQARWQRAFQSPVKTLADAGFFALGDLGLETSGYYLLDLLVVVVAVVAIFGVAPTARGGRMAWEDRGDRMAMALLVHGLLTVVIWFAQPFPGRPFMSVPRFALVVPAVLLGLTAATARPAYERAWATASTILLTIHLVLFSRWWYVF